MVYFRVVPFPFPCQKPKGIFPWYLLWEFGWAPGNISHNTVGHPHNWAPTGVFNSWIACTEHPLNSSILTVQVSLLWNLFPWLFLLMSLCFHKLCLPVFTCLSLQPWGQWFVLCLHFFYGCKKCYWFFHLLSFLLVLKTKWWCPNFLCAELETGSPILSFKSL